MNFKNSENNKQKLQTQFGGGDKLEQGILGAFCVVVALLFIYFAYFKKIEKKMM